MEKYIDLTTQARMIIHNYRQARCRVAERLTRYLGIFPAGMRLRGDLASTS